MAKGDGTFKERNGKIYVHGTVNGKFYRKSIGKDATTINRAWCKKQDPIKVLAGLLGISIKDDKSTETDLRKIGYEALEMQFMAKKMSKNHHRDKTNAFENKVLMYFDGVAIEHISVKDIVEWINQLKQDFSYTHVKFVKNLFASIFRYAKNDLRVIDFNPFDSESVQKIDLAWTPDTEAYTTKEVALILNESIGWFKVYLDLSAKYGFRPSELMLIKWSDLDIENGLLKLQRAYNADNEIIEYTKVVGNKNHFRIIPLFDSTIELLKNYFNVRPNREWVFVNKDNKPYVSNQSIIDYHLKPLLKELDIEYKALYALRRSYASIMKYAGQNLADIQEIIGHAEGSDVTERHYITADILSPEDLKKQSKKQEDLFNVLVPIKNKEEE